MVEATVARVATTALVADRRTMPVPDLLWRHRLLHALSVVVGRCRPVSAGVAGESEGCGTVVDFDSANFVHPALDTNPFHPLRPGMQWVRGGTTQVGGREVPHEVITTMTDVIRVIDGVPTVAMLDESTDFLKVKLGDTVQVLLARATPDQAAIDLTVVGFYDRLPGFPDGADAVIDIDLHTAMVPTMAPDFFLIAPVESGSETFDRAAAELASGPAATNRSRRRRNVGCGHGGNKHE